MKLFVSQQFNAPTKVKYAAIIWTIIIFVLIAIPGNQIPKVSDWMDAFKPDKIVHIIIFAPFSLLWARYFWLKNKSKSVSIAISAFFGIFYAIVSEIMQYYVFIGRNGNIADAIADAFGVAVGLLIFNVWLSKDN